MSTNDVPGAKVANNDELAMGCWAEHEDGSLLVVESTEGSRVIYSMFDLSKKQIIEYRDAMPEDDFKEEFSWDPNKAGSVRWTWHDKTPFPWDRVIKQGARDGMHLPSADDYQAVAEKIARSRGVFKKGKKLKKKDLKKLGERIGKTVSRTIQDAISRLEL